MSVPFETAGGHRDKIFHGKESIDGRGTVCKVATAWEAFWYLGVTVASFEDAYLEKNVIVNAPSDKKTAFSDLLKALRKFKEFLPEPVCVKYPDDFKEEGSTPLPTSAQANPDLLKDWIQLQGDINKELVSESFVYLYTELMALHEYNDLYDKTRWWVGLIDQTSGIDMACVMDVKLGCYRTSPLTPAEKAATAERKDAGKIMQRTGARLVWLKRYLSDGKGGELTPEVITSKNHHSIEKETEFKNILQAFFSSSGKIEETGVVDDREDREVKGPNPADFPAEEKKRCAALRSKAVKTVDDLLHFFEKTPEGKFLIENFAFVSSSFLFVYDAKNHDNCSVKLIDLGRSGPRYLNFDEKKLGFIQGIRTVSEYLK